MVYEWTGRRARWLLGSTWLLGLGAVTGCAAASLEGDAVDRGPLNPASTELEADLDGVEGAVAQNRLVRIAIFEGNALASRVFEGAVNAQLREAGFEGVSYEDHPMTLTAAPRGLLQGLETGEAVDPTVPSGASPSDSCPFARPVTPIADTSVSCRYLVGRSIDLARTRGVQALASTPLPDEFVADAPNPDEVRRWYGRAFSFAVEASLVHALDAFRQAGACDREPTTQQSAFERGVLEGRRAVQEAVRAEEARTPETQCETDPIVQRAVATLDPNVLAQATPLCAGYEPSGSDEAAYLAQARQQFVKGIEQGIREGADVERGRLVREWTCFVDDGGDGGGDGGGTGDPLVLDLGGDGIESMPLMAGAFFDFGDGRVHTEWLSWRDGFLVLDRDHDGRIEASELFGDVTVTADGATASDGLEALALYDRPERNGNGDGRIDASDGVFEALKVWVDRDADARTDEGELKSLSELGIVAIDYRHERFVRVDGSEGLATDVWFEYRRVGRH